MRNQPINHLLAASLLLAALAMPPTVRASLTVHSGWDLLQAQSAFDLSLFGTTWQGVPLGSWNFGGSIGVQNVGTTDTIIHRLSDATAPAYNNWVNGVPMQIDALQLETVAPTSLFGGPVGNYFVTLQSARGGPASTGTMDLYFGPEGNPHGTFDSSFVVFFDIHYGSLTGPIVNAPDNMMALPPNIWQHQAPDGALLIPGVNYLLNGTDIYQDFWSVPEPSSYALLLSGASLLALRRCCRRNPKQ